MTDETHRRLCLHDGFAMTTRGFAPWHGAGQQKKGQRLARRRREGWPLTDEGCCRPDVKAAAQGTPSFGGQSVRVL